MADNNNRISKTLSQDELNELTLQLTNLESALGFCLALTTEERQGLLKFGQVAQGFVDQALELARQDSSYMPSKFSVSEFEKDVTLLNQLLNVNTRMSRIQQKLKDTTLVVGSEAYKGALEVYKYAKLSGGPELAPTIDKLRELFQTQKSSKAEE